MTSANVSKVTAGMTVPTSASKKSGKDEQEARLNLANAILEYSMEYYNEYEMYSHSPNRKKHIPYIFKALIIDNSEKIGEIIQCQDGKN